MQEVLVQEDKGRTEVVGMLLAAVVVVVVVAVEEVVVLETMVVEEELLVHKPGLLAPMLRTASMTGQTMWFLIARSSQFSPQWRNWQLSSTRWC